MVTIIGNGMGDYDFDNISCDLSQFDIVLCDKNFKQILNNMLQLGYKDTQKYILEHYNTKNIAYIVTGSPYFFSAGILIAQKIPSHQLKIIDNTSSLKYIQEHFIISSNHIQTISLHGRNSIDLTKFLTSLYTFILCDKETITKLQDALKYLQKDDIEIFIGYKLGYKDEIIQKIDIYNIDDFDLTQPYVLLIKKLFNIEALSKDDDFITQRGMITKEYKRNLALQYLELKPNLILWDIGAGSGSCGIEAYKRYKVKTIFFEKQQLRCNYIKQNLTTHKVVDTSLIEGEAQNMFQLVTPNPNRIFIGGGGGDVIDKLPYLYDILELKGIILITAITLKNLSLMITTLDKFKIEYETISLSLTTYKGNLNLIEPQRQLFLIKIQK